MIQITALLLVIAFLVVFPAAAIDSSGGQPTQPSIELKPKVIFVQLIFWTNGHRHVVPHWKSTVNIDLANLTSLAVRAKGMYMGRRQFGAGMMNLTSAQSGVLTSVVAPPQRLTKLDYNWTTPVADNLTIMISGPNGTPSKSKVFVIA
ncbi:MAG: hypothetical protein NT074_02320 [Methanomicrobiales archaeon]|nr:hypothetical protein [Methanomicrobiales archaeon]